MNFFGFPVVTPTYELSRWLKLMQSFLTKWRDSKIKGFTRRDSKGDILYGF
jgi:hypothetical protein